MNDKIVVITGASSGIGKALAFEYASRGSKIVLAARNTEKLKEVEEEILAKGIEVLSVKTDVSIEEDCKNLIDKTVERFGGIDILINNAGISMRAMFADLELSVLKQLMDVNFGERYIVQSMPCLILPKQKVRLWV